MVTIAVVGANGRTGRAIVDLALKRGYYVRAGIHGPADGLPESDRCTILSCDATQYENVYDLLDGADAVISVLGHTPDSHSRVQTEAIQMIVKVMRKRTIRRIISLTGTGVRMPGDIVPWYDKLLNLAVQRIDPERLADGKAHATVLTQSQLDWTLVRVLKLEDRSPFKSQFTKHGPPQIMTTRLDVATAILDSLSSLDWVNKSPILGSTK